MTIDLLAVRTAKKHVKNYVDEQSQLMEAHHNAMNCRDCEDFLQLGIDAYHWVLNADNRLRVAMAEGEISVDEGDVIAGVIEGLCRHWLIPCDKAEEWIACLDKAEFIPDNLDEFRQCCQKMRATVRSFAFNVEEPLPPGLYHLQDAALKTFHNDKANIGLFD